MTEQHKKNLKKYDEMLSNLKFCKEYAARFERKTNEQKRCPYCENMMAKMGNTYKFECTNERCSHISKSSVFRHQIDLKFEIQKLHRINREIDIQERKSEEFKRTNLIER
jgi:hypothetical protein